MPRCAKVHYIRQLINDEYITQGGGVVRRTTNSVRRIRHIRFRKKVCALDAFNGLVERVWHGSSSSSSGAFIVDVSQFK